MINTDYQEMSVQPFSARDIERAARSSMVARSLLPFPFMKADQYPQKVEIFEDACHRLAALRHRAWRRGRLRRFVLAAPFLHDLLQSSSP
jgi:hypothetical protein